MPRWPPDAAALRAEQARLAAADPPLWVPQEHVTVGASYACSARAAADERGWGAAARKAPGTRAQTAVADGVVPAGYVPGLLALREGPLREAALRALSGWPERGPQAPSRRRPLAAHPSGCATDRRVGGLAHRP